MPPHFLQNISQVGRARGREQILSIIVPMLNESQVLPELLVHLQHWQQRGCEILLVDGGSTDSTAELATAGGFDVLRCGAGRAVQMNHGAAQAKGNLLLFLHADTKLPDSADDLIRDALQRHCWGRFNVRISGEPVMLRVVATLMNIRSCLTGIVTGDQAIFMRKEAFIQIGGFPSLPLMEDIEISKRLSMFGKPACLKAEVITSGRRWIALGVWRTIWLMWRLRFAYWRGVPAEQLVKRYRQPDTSENISRL
jgi:rSAM/selenodomain-associated transferase 2